MVRFDALRAVTKNVRTRATAFVDDECAERIEHVLTMLDQSLSHLEAARSASKVAGRCPATRRVLKRVADELSCDGRKGWAELTAPVREALTRTDAALEAVENAHAEAVERITRALSEAA